MDVLPGGSGLGRRRLDCRRRGSLTGETEPDQDPANTETGVIYKAGADSIICEIVWYDPPPESTEDIMLLMEAAADALDESADR